MKTVAAMALAILALAGQTRAQGIPSNIIAFGDSITRADVRFDQLNKGGYPRRLQNMLRRDDPGAIVHNFGRDSEVTAEGVSRITSALGQVPNADALTLMEGTNDIDLVVEGVISFPTVRANLASIGSKAASAGLEVFYATVIPRPPSARRDNNNQLTFALARELRDLAFRQQRHLVDPYEGLRFIPGVFRDLYGNDASDVVGHPNSAGYDVLADLFFDAVTGVDSQGPVPGELEPGYDVAEIGPPNDLELVIFDLGAGIDRDNTTLTINGIAVETTLTGNDRRRNLSHDTKANTLGCYAKVGIRAADLADPPNITDRVYKEFRVRGGQILKGDFNNSCRVDGVDLLFIALAFGSRTGEARYFGRVDLNNDGVIDGRDFAELAKNFGRSSS